MALTNFGAFTTNNPDEQRYLVAMTDGNDDSSLLNGMPGGAVDTLITRAQGQPCGHLLRGLREQRQHQRAASSHLADGRPLLPGGDDG